MLWKKTIVSLVLLAASAGLAAIAAGTSGPELGPPFAVPAFDADSITGITVEGGKYPVELSKVDGSWWVLPDKVPADDKVIETAIGKANDLEVGTVRSSNPELQSDLGVSDDGMKVILKAGDQTVFSFFLGNDTADKKGNFIRRIGARDVYATNGRIRTNFEKDKKYWRRRKVVDVDRDQITGLTIERDGKAYSFAKSDDGWAFAETPADLPANYRLDSTSIAAIAGGLAGLTAKDFADGKTEEETGLKPPHIVVTAAGGFGDPIRLLIGGRADKDYYVKRADEPWIYQVAEYNGRRVDVDVDGFRDLTVASFPSADAREIEVTSPAGTTRFVRGDSRLSWRLASTTEPVEPGFAIDPEAVQMLVATAARFSGDELVGTEAEPSYGFAKPTGEVDVTLADGSKKHILVGASAGEDSVYVAGDDGFVYRAGRRAADRLVKPLAEMKVAAQKQQTPMLTPEMIQQLPPEVAQQFLERQRKEVLQRQLMRQFNRQQNATPAEGGSE